MSAAEQNNGGVIGSGQTVDPKEIDTGKLPSWHPSSSNTPGEPASGSATPIAIGGSQATGREVDSLRYEELVPIARQLEIVSEKTQFCIVTQSKKEGSLTLVTLNGENYRLAISKDGRFVEAIDTAKNRFPVLYLFRPNGESVSMIGLSCKELSKVIQNLTEGYQIVLAKKNNRTSQ